MTDTADAPTTVDRRERKKLANRDALRTAALELFVEKGYENTTIRDITDRADLGTRTFYRHYDGKDDLVLVDVREYFADAEEVLRACPPDWSPIRGYLEVIDKLEEKWTRDDSELAFLYDLIETDPLLNGRFYYELMQHHGRVSLLYAERLGLEQFDPRLWALAAVAVDGFLGSLVVKVRGESDMSSFEYGEQIILMMAEGLDHDVARARKRQRAKPAPKTRKR